MSYLKNTAGQYLYFAMVSASDGSAITSGTVNGYRSIDGGSQASVTGSISHKGNGQWELALSQADTNGDEIGYLFTHTSGIPVSISIVTDSKKVGALNDLSAANVNAEVDAAIETYHLDHLLAAAYDPASKPGAADALLNELVENDGGVSRFTANALEQAPVGGSAPTAGEIADAVWDEPTSGHTTAGTFGEQVKTDIDAILVDTAEIGAAGAGLTAVPWNAAWDAEVQSEATDALNAYDPPTKAELDAGLAALNDLSAAEVNAEVVDALNVDTYAEPGSVPAATASLAAKIGWLFTLARNKLTQTATTQTLRNDADSGNIGTSTVSDDGTTATRGEWS